MQKYYRRIALIGMMDLFLLLGLAVCVVTAPAQERWPAISAALAIILPMVYAEFRVYAKRSVLSPMKN